MVGFCLEMMNLPCLQVTLWEDPAWRSEAIKICSICVLSQAGSLLLRGVHKVYSGLGILDDFGDVPYGKLEETLPSEWWTRGFVAIHANLTSEHFFRSL